MNSVSHPVLMPTLQRRRHDFPLSLVISLRNSLTFVIIPTSSLTQFYNIYPLCKYYSSRPTLSHGYRMRKIPGLFTARCLPFRALYRLDHVIEREYIPNWMTASMQIQPDSRLICYVCLTYPTLKSIFAIEDRGHRLFLYPVRSIRFNGIIRTSGLFSSWLEHDKVKSY